MNEMYDCSGCFDRFGGVVEPPDGYYFAPRVDEEPEWQLPEPGAFASAKSFRDKVALPLVNKLKELVKSLTIQCVRLKEEVLQLRDKVKHLTSDVEFYKGKIRDMSAKTELLQEKLTIWSV